MGNCTKPQSKPKCSHHPFPTLHSQPSDKALSLTTKHSTPKKERRSSKFFESFRSLASFRLETPKRASNDIPDLNIKMLQRMRTRLQKQRFLPYSAQPSRILKSLQVKWKNFYQFEKMYITDIRTKPVKYEVLDAFWKDITRQIQLYQWRNIKVIKLEFESCSHIDDHGLKVVGRNLAKNFQNLERLTIHFSWCDKITDAGLEALAFHIFRNLTKIKILKVEFLQCNQITEKGLKFIVSQITRNLPGLKQLIMDFRMCNEIPDEDSKSLGNALNERLVNLEQLTFKFGWYGEITHEDFTKRY